MHASAVLISDLHLTPSMPRTAERFFEFLEKEARAHEALIILGDLFEYWVGDDAKARSPFHLEVAQKNQSPLTARHEGVLHARQPRFFIGRAIRP